jgi:hypothetical protein
VNAIPSVFHSPRTRCSEGSSFRDVAIIVGLSVFRVGVKGLARERGEPVRPGDGLTDRTRHAMTASRGAPSARPLAQGGTGRQTRRIAPHPASHRLPSATTSGLPDADRSLISPLVLTRSGKVWTFRRSTSRLKAQPGQCPAPYTQASDTKLVPPEGGVLATSTRGQSRGKGVLAA